MPPPDVCHVTTADVLRSAMALRLLIADAEFLSAQLTRSDVIVVQAGTWDSMSMPSLQVQLDVVGNMIAAIRELRLTAATRDAREELMGPCSCQTHM